MVDLAEGTSSTLEVINEMGRRRGLPSSPFRLGGRDVFMGLMPRARLRTRDGESPDLPRHQSHSCTSNAHCKHSVPQDCACRLNTNATSRSGQRFTSDSRLPTSTPATIEPPAPPHSNAAASPPKRPQEMESSGPGALALQAAPLPTHSHTPEPLFGVTSTEPNEYTTNNNPGSKEPALNGFTSYNEEQPPMTSYSTPVHNPTTNHFDPSHVRETVEQPQQSSPTSTDAANILANPEFRRPSAIDPFAAAPEDPFAVGGANGDFGAAALDTFAFPNGDLDNAAAESLAATEYDASEFAVEDELIDEHPDMQAFAKLVFADGDYFVTTTTVGLGRDMEFEKSWKRKRKLEQAWEKHSQQAMRAFEAASAAGSEFGQPEGDAEKADPSSKDSHSLEGRPAKGLPSTYSEQGGVVSYAGYSDDEMRDRKSRRRRRHLFSKASSDTTSIAPASLHTTTMWPNLVDEESGANAGLSKAFIPVHPVAGREGDIKKVSKEHVIISYNFDEERWEAEIKGKYCWVNDTNYAKGDIVPLGHHTRFEFVGIFFNFKLPDQERASPGPSRGTFSEYGDLEDEDEEDDEDEDDDHEDMLKTSPAARKLSGAIDLDSSDDDTPLAATKLDKKPTKIKLKLKNPLAEKKRQEAEAKKAKEERKAAKLAAKEQRKEEKRKAKEAKEAASQSPDTARKGKKPKEASKQPAKAPAKQPAASGSAPDPAADSAGQPPVDAADAAMAEQLTAAVKQEDGKPAKEKASPPAPPPIIIEAGSVLEGVAAEAMPERRKGPGRPPKNGLISKRDQAFIRRKTKEFEKMGREVPPLNVLLDIVRAENKAREAAQKAAARGEAPPPESAIVQSIELDPALMMANQPPKQDPMPMVSADGVPAMSVDQRPSSTPMNHMPRPPSPKPKRIVKSPSPMKPESAFTEDELKKPSATYVVILDEILRAHPQGQADLQEIYDLICKRYPYFKYRSGTNGWQSSVRHNLLQNERFKENGRSGKGKLWAINYDIPLEREKKRRMTPPPRSTMPNGQQYSQYPPYGNPNYQYGPPGSNSQGQQYNNAQGASGNYYSPYGQGQAGYGQPYGQQQQNGYGQQPNGQSSGASQQPPQPSAPAPKAAGEFQTIVDEIMAYRAQYLAGAQGEELERKTNVFQKCINITSDVFHGQNKEAAKPEGPAEIEVCTALDKIFERHGNLKPIASQSATPAADAPQPAQNQATGIDGAAQGQGQGQGQGQTASDAPPANATGNTAPTPQASSSTAPSVAAQPQPSSTGAGNSNPQPTSQPAYPPPAPSVTSQVNGQQPQQGAYPQPSQASPYKYPPQQTSGTQPQQSGHATATQATTPGTQQQGDAPQAQAQAQPNTTRQWPPPQQNVPPPHVHAPLPNAAAPTPQSAGQGQQPVSTPSQYQRPAWPSTQNQGPKPSYNAAPASQQQTATQSPAPTQPQSSVVPNYGYPNPLGSKPSVQGTLTAQQTSNSTAASQQKAMPQSQTASYPYPNAPAQPAQPAVQAPPPVSQPGVSAPPSATASRPGSQGHYSATPAAANGPGTARPSAPAQHTTTQGVAATTPTQGSVHAATSQPRAQPPQPTTASHSVGPQFQSAASNVPAPPPAAPPSTNGSASGSPDQPIQHGTNNPLQMTANSDQAPPPLPPQVAPTPSPALTPVQQTSTPASVHSESKQGTPAAGEAAVPPASPKKRLADSDEDQGDAKRLKTD